MRKDTTLVSYILHVILSFYYPDYVHEPTSVGRVVHCYLHH